MPVEIIRCDSSNQEAWKGNIDKLKEAIIKPRGGNAKHPRHPRLVLSVVGDSSSFVPKPWLTPVFQLGLIETAKGAKDCVILYKGSNERVSRLVGKAVDDFDVMNRQKAKKECGDDEAKNLTFISLIGLQPDVKRLTKRIDKTHLPV